MSREQIHELVPSIIKDIKDSDKHLYLKKEVFLMTLAIFLMIAIFLVGIQTAIPFLVKRTVVFGVTVPEKYLKDEKLITYKKSYALMVSLVSFVVIGGYLLWAIFTIASEQQTVLVGTIIQIGIILFSLSLYFYFHGKMIQLKNKNKWSENLKQVKIADLSVRSQDEMLPWYVYLLPIIMTIGVFGYTILQYDLLPDQIPTHWGINGDADAFTEKTPMSAILMPLTLLFMQLMFLGVQIGTKNPALN